MNPSIKQKAKDFYVVHGFAIDTILKLMEGEVSRKTLYNWKNDDRWDDERKAQLKKAENLKTELYELLQQAIREAKTNPTSSNIFSVAKLMASYLQAVKVEQTEIPEKEAEEDKPKQITPETVEKIKKEILGL